MILIFNESVLFERMKPCTRKTKKTSSPRKNKKWTKCDVKPDGKKGYHRLHWGDPDYKVTGKSGDTPRKKQFNDRFNCKTAKKGTAKKAACDDW